MYRIALSVLFISVVSQAESKKEVCGQVSFSKSMNCEKAEIYFDISKCDDNAVGIIPATKVLCENGEMTAELKYRGTNYAATFVKHIDGNWAQSGDVIKSGKSKANKKEEIVVTDISETPKKSKKSKKSKSVNAEPPAASAEVKPAHAEVAVTPVLAVEKPKDDLWKLSFSGFAYVEQESLGQFGEGVSKNFDSTDSLANQSATSLISNLQLSVAKENVKFDTLFEIGEVFYGDEASGGKQGLRKSIIELRNFNFEEKYDKNWFVKVGLWTINADPRGFVLSDHLAGAQIRNENGAYKSQLWVAKSTAAKPGTVLTADTYAGFSFNEKVNDDTAYTFFATYRSTRETFKDKDETTDLIGPSTYYWVGINSINTQIVEKTNLEFNLIASQSQFKADNGGPSDINTTWLGHARIDRELSKNYSLGLDILATSGSSDPRVNGIQVISHRKSYTANQAYLLSVATNDGLDDGAGSTRSTNYIGRLDVDEGLQMAVVSLSKTLTDKWDAIVRYGQIQTAAENKISKTNDYGSEIDVKVKFKPSSNTSWILEGGLFNPGKYFAEQDNAHLISLKYRLDF